MSYATAKDGTKIFYKDWGMGSPVVFSHGWPLNGDIWDPQMVFLSSNGFRTVQSTTASAPCGPTVRWLM